MPAVAPRRNRTSPAGPAAAPAPELGQHNDEVLKEIGYRAEDIAGFRERKVIQARLTKRPGAKASSAIRVVRPRTRSASACPMAGP